jgi:N6-L-threonylcarbamoyladenine synthase
VISQAFDRAGALPKDIQGIAVTRGPGLIGSLLVGIGVAKGMALALDMPVCGVNHLHGHLFSAFLERRDLVFPFVGLVVSGGHTSLFHLKAPFDIEPLGKTRDDAAGEAFDKVAKLLGLGYPGGAVIEELARGMDPGDLRFPRALMEGAGLDFSFSGVKTAVLNYAERKFGVLEKSGRDGSFHPVAKAGPATKAEREIRRIAAAFQDAVVEVLVEKACRAANRVGCDTVVVCGGVAANGRLRSRMMQEGADRGIEAVFPSPRLCTDNAAMIAARGDALLSAGLTDDLDFGAKSRW